MNYQMKILPSNKNKKMTKEELRQIEENRIKGIKRRTAKNIKRKMLKKNKTKEKQEDFRTRLLKEMFPNKLAA